MSARGRHPLATVTAFPGAHQGSLTTTSGKQVPVRAYERADDVLMLVLMLDVGERLDAEEVEPALLEYTCVRGLVRLQGQARFEGNDLVRFEAADDQEPEQRRDFVRVLAPRTVTIADQQGREAGHAHTVDLSGGGMLLTGTDGLEIDGRVRFSLDLSDGEPPIDGAGRVVRASGEDRCAVMFDDISGPERQRLIRFVFECMRTARAKTRGDRI